MRKKYKTFSSPVDFIASIKDEGSPKILFDDKNLINSIRWHHRLVNNPKSEVNNTYYIPDNSQLDKLTFLFVIENLPIRSVIGHSLKSYCSSNNNLIHIKVDNLFPVLKENDPPLYVWPNLTNRVLQTFDEERLCSEILRKAFLEFDSKDSSAYGIWNVHFGTFKILPKANDRLINELEKLLESKEKHELVKSEAHIKNDFIFSRIEQN